MPTNVRYADEHALELAYNGVTLCGLDPAVIERNVARGWITPAHAITSTGRRELLRRLPHYGKIPQFNERG
jgi:hypothetical protein